MSTKLKENLQIKPAFAMREALQFWHDVVVKSLQNKHAYDLSARQTAILLSIYTSSSAHTIKSLAEDLVISKPAICRAIDALSIIGLVKRKRDSKDKRIIYLQRTVKGSVFLSEFAETIKTSLAKHI